MCNGNLSIHKVQSNSPINYKNTNTVKYLTLKIMLSKKQIWFIQGTNESGPHDVIGDKFRLVVSHCNELLSKVTILNSYPI